MHNSCVEKQEKLSGSRLSDRLRFRINTVFQIQYSYVRWIFPYFLTDESNLNVSEISIDPSSEQIVSVHVPNTYK